MRRGDLDEAEKTICKAIEIAPKFALAHWTYGEILENKNDIRGAIKETEESNRLYDEFPQIDDDDETDEEDEQRLPKLRAKLETTQ